MKHLRKLAEESGVDLDAENEHSPAPTMSPYFTDEEIAHMESQLQDLKPEDFSSRHEYLAARDAIEADISSAIQFGPIIHPA